MLPHEEARSLLVRFSNLTACQQVIAHQFDVLQARTHMMLTLATLTLTITGFSGPKIAASNVVSQYTMILGLVFVLAAVVVTLGGTLRIRWLTQIGQGEAEAVLQDMIAYRNQKTRLFRIELTLLVLGLTFYVASVITYMLVGLDAD